MKARNMTVAEKLVLNAEGFNQWPPYDLKQVALRFIAKFSLKG